MTRNLITSGPATGADVMANLNSHIERLWNAVALPLTSIGGTANALTATLNPPLLFGLVVGMKFTLTVPAANTGGVTLVINGAAAVAVLRSDGSALTNGALSAGSRVLLEWDGAAMRVLAGASADADGGLPQRIDFTASGTFTKAVYGDFPDDHMVMVEGWGGGGGGGVGSNARGGGGGGGYSRREFRFVDLPSAVTVAVGAGGGGGAAGGNTTFGALLTAYGGGAGSFNASVVYGGGGGGSNQAGGNATGSANGAGGFQGGGGLVGSDSTALYGGGGGGRQIDSQPFFGGRAVFGGGGGGYQVGGTNVVGGASLWGGNGGSGGVAGAAPGGGGGGGAAGARGEVRIWL